MKNSLIEQTPLLFRDARGKIMLAIKNLWEIRDKGLWAGRTSSFSEYIEQDCQQDKGQVSRWLSVYEYYVIDGGVELTQLEEVNPERLYIARKLKGTPAQQVQKAISLTGNELRSEAAMKDNGDEHEHEWVEFCSICRIRR